MNRSKIVSSVKRQEEEKVGFSLKLPISLKEELQKLAEKESISMNALVVATLQSMIEDECGQKLVVANNLLSEYKIQVVREIELLDEHGVDEDNVQHYQKMKTTNSQINDFLKD